MEAPFTRLGSLVETLERALHPYLDKPFAFFGHSMGALISFELARHLRRRSGVSPVHLLVSGARAPQRKDPFPPIHRLPDTGFVQQLRRLGGTPEDVLKNPEFMSLMLPTIRADFALCETYVHRFEPPLTCPISVYGGHQDSRVAYEDLLAWRYQTRSSFRVLVFPGRHFFLHTAEAAIVDVACRDLARSLAGLKNDENLSDRHVSGDRR